MVRESRVGKYTIQCGIESSAGPAKVDRARVIQGSVGRGLVRMQAGMRGLSRVHEDVHWCKRLEYSSGARRMRSRRMRSVNFPVCTQQPLSATFSAVLSSSVGP